MAEEATALGASTAGRSGIPYDAVASGQQIINMLLSQGQSNSYGSVIPQIWGVLGLDEAYNKEEADMFGENEYYEGVAGSVNAAEVSAQELFSDISGAAQGFLTHVKGLTNSTAN